MSNRGLSLEHKNEIETTNKDKNVFIQWFSINNIKLTVSLL